MLRVADRPGHERVAARPDEERPAELGEEVDVGGASRTNGSDRVGVLDWKTAENRVMPSTISSKTTSAWLIPTCGRAIVG